MGNDSAIFNNERRGIKRKVDGSVECLKARLIAKGFHHRKGLNFDLTYNPVIKIATVGKVLAITSVRRWKLYHIDVCNAFLNGTINEMVYMSQPLDMFIHFVPDMYVVWRKRSTDKNRLCAPGIYDRLNFFLVSVGFHNSLVDSSLFVKCTNGVSIYVLIYVDDFIIIDTSSSDVLQFISLVFSTHFTAEILIYSHFSWLLILKSPI